MKKILIAEDDKGTREFYQEFLPRCGFIVSAAENAEVAKAKLDQEDFDVVISDFDMGRLANGVDVAQHIKTRGKNKPIFILMSGNSEETIRDLSPGYDSLVKEGFIAECWHKPMMPEEFFRRARALIEPTHPLINSRTGEGRGAG